MFKNSLVDQTKVVKYHCDDKLIQCFILSVLYFLMGFDKVNSLHYDEK